MHDYIGNEAMGTGYSCQMRGLIEQWRGLWSATPGTTAPDAPFGLVTLAPGTDEGHPSIGAMRWSQVRTGGVGGGWVMKCGGA
jgi:hypothetical protein